MGYPALVPDGERFNWRRFLEAMSPYLAREWRPGFRQYHVFVDNEHVDLLGALISKYGMYAVYLHACATWPMYADNLSICDVITGEVM